MKNLYTDLALEAKEIAEEGRDIEIKGESLEKREQSNAVVSTIKILDEQGAQTIGKAIGTYVTIEIPTMGELGSEDTQEVCELVRSEIANLIHIKPDGLILVCGLGNYNITPDALGPKVVNDILVTRHIKQYEPGLFTQYHFGQAAAIAPGVLGQTGVESAEIIKSIVSDIKPDLVIVIDSLASRKMSRLARTVQISDTGITPGGGIGNMRAQINEQSLGVPVISIGVPMVVDAATLTSDVLDQVAEATKSEDGSLAFQALSDDERYALIKNSLTPYDLNLIVTPKEIDAILTKTARIVSLAINGAIHRELSMDDIMEFIA